MTYPEEKTDEYRKEKWTESFAQEPFTRCCCFSAQEKAAEIRKRKEKEAEEAQREKDRQRRVEGQLMAQAERERNVNLAEQTRQEIDKEKRQDAEHRQKILQQLREDQEERDRRAQSARAITSTKDLPAVNKPPEVSASGIDYNKSKIQFRHETAEGMRNFVGVFEATDPLGVAFDFAKGETGLKGEITFLQMYPRKDFTKSDAKTTLRLLGLVPNAVLMIVLAVRFGCRLCCDSFAPLPIPVPL